MKTFWFILLLFAAYVLSGGEPLFSAALLAVAAWIATCEYSDKRRVKRLEQFARERKAA